MARVDRLRVSLVAGTVLLLLVLLAAMSYSRYRAGKSWLSKLQKRSGVSITQETDGFTYSQSSGGRTIFTLHAAKAVQHTQDMITLHDVVLTVYEASGRADKIYGNEFEWDKSKGIARAVGSTTMDIPLHAAKGAEPDSTLHVKTSGLVYLRNLGVGATPELVEFEYAGLKCTAKGAEFDKDPSELHLLADVRADGEYDGKQLSVRAARADVSRARESISFVQPVAAYGAQHGQAQNAIVHLHDHGDIDRVEAAGAVALEEGARHVMSDRAEARFGATKRVEAARFTGGVKFSNTDAAGPSEGSAADVQLHLDRVGRLMGATATGAARFASKRQGAGGTPLLRQVRGDSLDAVFVPLTQKLSRLQTVHVIGSAVAEGDSEATAAGARELRATRVAADDLTASFIADGSKGAGVRPDTVSGRSHTELRQTGAHGFERVSSGDTLQIAFAPVAGADAKQMQVATARQDGHVSFHSRTPGKTPKPGGEARADDVASGSADHAAYAADAEKLVLTGNARVVDGTTSMSAATIALDQGAGDVDARGDVVASIVGDGSAVASTSTAKRPAATHISAAHAVLHHATNEAEFDAGDGRPARMWQDASQVEANRIVLNGTTHTLVATPSVVGVVRSVFAGNAVSSTHSGGPPAKPAEPRIVRVESHGLQYSDATREAAFSGPVTISGTGEEVRAKRAVATFSPAVAKGAAAGASAEGLPAGSLERVVASGDVRLAEPGRQGSGEQLVYTVADGSLLLTGTPASAPRVTDAQQGTVTGASLLLRPGESTIVVTGGAATESVAPGAKPPRARVETKVRQQGK